MLVELKNTELVEINGGCASCFEEGQRWRRALELGLLLIMFL
jgi:hypothetical protein